MAWFGNLHPWIVKPDLQAAERPSCIVKLAVLADALVWDLRRFPDRNARVRRDGGTRCNLRALFTEEEAEDESTRVRRAAVPERGLCPVCGTSRSNVRPSHWRSQGPSASEHSQRTFRLACVGTVGRPRPCVRCCDWRFAHNRAPAKPDAARNHSATLPEAANGNCIMGSRTKDEHEDEEETTSRASGRSDAPGPAPAAATGASRTVALRLSRMLRAIILPHSPQRRTGTASWDRGRRTSTRTRRRPPRGRRDGRTPPGPAYAAATGASCTVALRLSRMPRAIILPHSPQRRTGTASWDRGRRTSTRRRTRPRAGVGTVGRGGPCAGCSAGRKRPSSSPHPGPLPAWRGEGGASSAGGQVGDCGRVRSKLEVVTGAITDKGCDQGLRPPACEMCGLEQAAYHSTESGREKNLFAQWGARTSNESKGAAGQ